MTTKSPGYYRDLIESVIRSSPDEQNRPEKTFTTKSGIVITKSEWKEIKTAYKEHRRELKREYPRQSVDVDAFNYACEDFGYDMDELYPLWIFDKVIFGKPRTEEHYLEMVKENPFAVSIIPNPSEEIQMMVVNKRPDLIGEIRDPTVAVQKIALIADWQNLSGIKNIAPELLTDTDVKRSILADIINDLKRKPSDQPIRFRYFLDRVKSAIDDLRKNGFKWPELSKLETALERSYRTDVDSES